MFRMARQAAFLTTFHYNFYSSPSFPSVRYGDKLQSACVHSALHQRDTATGRPGRLWCPPRKAIRPAVPFFARKKVKVSECCGLAAQRIFLGCRAINVAKTGGARQSFTAPLLSLRGV